MRLRALFAVLLMVSLSGCATTPQLPEFLGWMYTTTPPAAPGMPGMPPLPGEPELVPPGGVMAPQVGPPPTTAFFPVANGDVVWDKLVDATDNYFEIAREERVRQVGDVITEGRLTTSPEVASTILEPWKGDSVGIYERWEATLQSQRRQAVIRMAPGQGGWLIDVAVYKELEDVPQAQFATASAAAFRTDQSITRYIDPVGSQPTNAGWIPQGRDPLLEQRILRTLERKLKVQPVRRIRGG